MKTITRCVFPRDYELAFVSFPPSTARETISSEPSCRIHRQGLIKLGIIIRHRRVRCPRSARGAIAGDDKIIETSKGPRGDVKRDRRSLYVLGKLCLQTLGLSD